MPRGDPSVYASCGQLHDDSMPIDALNYETVSFTQPEQRSSRRRSSQPNWPGVSVGAIGPPRCFTAPAPEGAG